MKKKTNFRLVPVITMLSLLFLFFNIEQLKNFFPTDISSGNTARYLRLIINVPVNASKVF